MSRRLSFPFCDFAALDSGIFGLVSAASGFGGRRGAEPASLFVAHAPPGGFPVALPPGTAPSRPSAVAAPWT